jgi:hypothetical protein
MPLTTGLLIILFGVSAMFAIAYIIARFEKPKKVKGSATPAYHRTEEPATPATNFNELEYAPDAPKNN